MSQAWQLVQPGLVGKREGNAVQKKARVLVADDDYELRQLIGHLLREDGHEVIEFNNGPTLLAHLGDCLLERHQGQPPDLVVSDIRMPGYTGIDVLFTLRKAHSTLPVILMSAFDDDFTHFEADLFGVALLHKPFDPDDLRTLVLNLAPKR